jgi:hypothetical protein
LDKKNKAMVSEVIIDEKKYVILPFEEYKSLKIKAAPHAKRSKLLTIDEAEAYSIELINKWATEKSQLSQK